MTGTSAAIASLDAGHVASSAGARHQRRGRRRLVACRGPGGPAPACPAPPPASWQQPTENTQIDLTWTAPAITGGSPITGYRIEESLPTATPTWTTLEANTNGPGTTYAHTGLAAGTTRHYRVSAINSNGAGAASNVDGATTGTTVPGAPTGLQATASGNTRINLSWTAPASDRRLPHHRLQDRGLL